MSERKPIEIFMQRLTDAQQELLQFVTAALVARPDDVEDVVQETNYALISRAAEYRPDRPFMPWAIGFAKNQVRAYRKRAGRDRLVFDDSLLDLYEKTAFAPPAEPDTPLRIRSLLACLGRLPERQRSLIDRHYRDGLPLSRIAAEEKRSESAVRMMVLRARARLAECVRRLCALGLPGEEPAAEPPPPTPFDELMSEVLDAPRPDPARGGAFLENLRGNPSGMAAYSDQILVHTLLRRAYPAAAKPSAPRRRAFPWLRAAAAVALAAGLAFGIQSLRTRQAAPRPAPLAAAPSEPSAPPEPAPSAPPLRQTPSAPAAPAPQAAPAPAAKKETNTMNKATLVAAAAATTAALAAPLPAPAASATADQTKDSAERFIDTRPGATLDAPEETFIETRPGELLDSPSGPIDTAKPIATLYILH